MKCHKVKHFKNTGEYNILLVHRILFHNDIQRKFKHMILNDTIITGSFYFNGTGFAKTKNLFFLFGLS